ncbi:hypothetical protein SAMN06265379_101826 [Saccharicrinis carchari]|uniref:Uncharacterized protein n=2 Tax=Saccharicrinis carchari TaxID=1168039 RepID=A0A521BAF6_SACCC|nr:hypothetical protein SAMN06265379_101826 [Saccharicrinis carchari]
MTLRNYLVFMRLKFKELFGKTDDNTVKLKRKIFWYFVIEVLLVIALLGFTFFLITVVLP